jgi:hypothetical protein
MKRREGMRRKSKTIVRAMAVASALLLGCSAAAAPAKPELFYDAKDAVTSLAPDGSGGVYALTSNGQLIRAAAKGSATIIAKDVAHEGWCWPCIAVRSDGTLLLAESQAADKNTISSVAKDGSKKTIISSDDEIFAMAADASNNIYYSCFRTDGTNLSVTFDPSRINGAEFIAGEIWKVDPSGGRARIYEGGLPMALGVDAKGALYAAIWGKKGSFSAESGDYAVADPRHRLFVLFGRESRVALVGADGSESLLAGKLLAVSAALPVKSGLVLCYGMEGTETSGFYGLRASGEPQALFRGEAVESLTASCVSGGALFYGDTEGAITWASLAALK